MKVVLAFSGGLDTSYCSKYISKDLGHDVYAVTVNTGGFDGVERIDLERRARELGVAGYQFIDITEDFYHKGIRFLLFGNVLKNNTYPLSVSAERVFQAIAIAEYAQSINADAIAHGSTGAGNDQVRFDLIFESLCPNLVILTPIRDQSLSREEEIDYLRSNGIEGDWQKAAYSINKGLWGTSIGGRETLTSDQYLSEVAFTKPLTSEGEQFISIGFEQGEPVSLDGKEGTPVEIIQAIERAASAYAIGRDIHVGDTIVGIKGRVGFEAAAALVLIKAHHALEKHVLSKHQLFIKDQISTWYGNLIHEGQYLDPSMRNIEAFLASSQDAVTGKVEVQLAPYRFHVLGVKSPNDLMQSSYGQYGEKNTAWSGQDARSFARIISTQTKIFNDIHHGKS